MIKIMKYGEVPNEEIFKRNNPAADISGTVSAIIRDVRARGDEALLEYTEKFDGVNLRAVARMQSAPNNSSKNCGQARPGKDAQNCEQSAGNLAINVSESLDGLLKVSAEEIAEALAAVDPEFLGILERAAKNIREFHSLQLKEGFKIEMKDGSFTGQKITLIERVGIYIPGGTAAYPSTVLMNAIPAKVAGVKEIVMVTPPSKDGSIKKEVLAAAKISGVCEIYKVGGAQAIAALAYGTSSIRRVFKITGPGNAFVAEAKRQVYGQVSIDMIAGPSEILIVADSSANAAWLAADLLSQAEHDMNATAVLVTDSAALAKEVSRELEEQLPLLEREEIARASIENNGKIIVADSVEQAIEIANEIAPEHLELCVNDPFKYLDDVNCAGSVFLGNFTPEPVGDYFAGPNHTLPTLGTARFSSPLSVDDFVKKTQFMYYTEERLKKASSDIARFAKEEGLTAHAKSVLVRNKG